VLRRSPPLRQARNCRRVLILRFVRGARTRIGARCTVQANKHDGQLARFQYTPTRAQNQKRRFYEGSDTFRETYRWRAGIEATMSRLKYQINLAQVRVRGMPAMRYTVNLRALGLNIRRCAAAPFRRKTRPLVMSDRVDGDRRRKFSTVTFKRQHCKCPVSHFLPPRQLSVIARVPGVTTSSSSANGGALNTRRSTCGLCQRRRGPRRDWPVSDVLLYPPPAFVA
jgi:hypothetical protein